MKHLLITCLVIFFIKTGFAQNISHFTSENEINNESQFFLKDIFSSVPVNIESPNTKKHSKFHRISLRIAGGPYYHYGIVEFPKRVSFNLISLQGEGMIGYNFKNSHRLIHTAALFARRGITSRFIDPQLIYDQELPNYDFDEYENFNTFEEYEAGLIIGRWFRFSAGLGNQQFFDSNGRIMIFNYYTFTSGFCFGTRNVRWSFNFTGAGGNDYQNLHFRFYTGLNFYLNILKI